MKMKPANTFFIVLFLSCYVAQSYGGREHKNSFRTAMRSVINVHTKTFFEPPPVEELKYNETTIKEILAQSGTNSSSWDEFGVYIAPQHGSKSDDKIISLPGQPKVSFNQYSGYVTVDGRAGRTLFYYFVESPEYHSNKPLVLWLNGGPGCSSLVGAMVELGPFRVLRDGKTLGLNPYAWNKVANIIFLDSPAGVGFSYSNTTSDYASAGDKTTAQDTYTFLINWLERFPEYKERDFYIAGESYAGHYVPQLAKLILQMNRKTTPARVIHLQGIAVGNGLLDQICLSRGGYDFLYKHAVISKHLRDTIIRCESGFPGITQLICESALQMIDERRAAINIYAFNFPSCNSISIIPNNTQFDPCTEKYAEAYFNMPQVQEALGAKATKWEMCSGKFNSLDWKDQEPTVLLTIKELMASGLRIWLYSGEADGVVPVEGTEYAIKALGLSVKTDRYQWYNAPDEVGGNVVEYSNLTFVTVKDSGHLVPSYQPASALTIFSSFLQGKLLPTAKF